MDVKNEVITYMCLCFKYLVLQNSKPHSWWPRSSSARIRTHVPGVSYHVTMSFVNVRAPRPTFHVVSSTYVCLGKYKAH